MTTFETLNKTKASLIINEYKEAKYTKCIAIKFDSKCEYRIKSYRAKEIKSLDTLKRIIIEK